MDSELAEFEHRRSGSIGRTSSAASSLRRRSINWSGALPLQTDEDIESEIVSQAGDIGDRALHSNSGSERNSLRRSLDVGSESRFAFSIRKDSLNRVLPDELLPSEKITPLSVDAPVDSSGNSPEIRKELPESLKLFSCLIHLAVLGIIGVLTRYLLEKLFGPDVIGVTSDQSILYLDLPSNMVSLSLSLSPRAHTHKHALLRMRCFQLGQSTPVIASICSVDIILYPMRDLNLILQFLLHKPSICQVGSFLMGWFGIVFKADITGLSDLLAIGLTTGFLGSLTTFSGWNQKMLDLSVEGKWVLSFLGFFVGLFLAAYSIIFGVQTADGFKWLLQRQKRSSRNVSNSISDWKVNTWKGQMAVLVILLVILGLLWGVSVALEKSKFHTGSSEAHLWLACIVGPAGVWIRWYLARLNGRGLGHSGLLKWIPFGTLIANVGAASVMAALATLKKAVKTQTCNTVATGIQFGLMGCLSTVSTFMAEFYAMMQSAHPWRAYAYALITILISFALGTLIYSVPVWTLDLD
ncbi:putative fluoride ion transporter CrcB [Dillenia turbinata]|uniref:Fluoride ion transporter CrcB n=1 Tax=Dillenia turbinata TaxID=194707 RepID=A0AAN8W1S1_9MAGN